MFVFIGGLGTTYAYAAPWMRQLARLHGELFYFMALKDASIQHLDHILESMVIPWCHQSGERVTLVGYSAGCSVLLHAFKHTTIMQTSYLPAIKILMIDPPALFPAWANRDSIPSLQPVTLHASYFPFHVPSIKNKKISKDPLLETLLFGNPQKELTARVLQNLLSITANWSLARWIVATGWCVAEGWSTPWTVNADILRMTLPKLRACLMSSILYHPAYPRYPNKRCDPTGIKHIWASTEKKSYTTYALLLAEHSPFIVVHLKRGMDHHMLYRQAHHLYV